MTVELVDLKENLTVAQAMERIRKIGVNSETIDICYVLDSEQRLIGMAPIVPGDKPYMKTGVYETFKQRLPWLLLLMVSSVFTQAIITSFEEALIVDALSLIVYFMDEVWIMGI